MKLNKLALSIARGTFLLDPRYIISYAGVISDYMEGKPVSFFGEEEKETETPQVAVMIGSDYRLEKTMLDPTSNLFAGYPNGSIAIIPVEGFIMQDDFCGAPGTETLTTWLKDAREASNISAVLLVINSGGGTVTGTKEFSDVIAETDIIKPVYAFGKGLIASAAYWIAAAAREIYVSSETVEIGSIGTAYKFSDNKESLKRAGVNQHYINADSSPDKNAVSLKALDGDYADLKALMLNPTNDIFLKAIKEFRGSKLQLTEKKIGEVSHFEPLTGHVYLAETAITNGLIDGIMNMDSMISYIHDKKAPTRKNNMSKFSKLSGLVNKAANTVTLEELTAVNEELTASGVNFGLVNMEDFAKLNADLQTANTAITASKNELSATQASLNTSNGKITTLEAAATQATEDKTTVDGELTTAQERVSELEAKLPGEKKAKAISKGDVTHTQPERALNSWEQKAIAKVGQVKE